MPRQHRPLRRAQVDPRRAQRFDLIDAGIAPSIGTVGDALDNALTSITITLHECSRLEQGFVEFKFQQLGKGVVHHVHPEGPFDIKDFNFTADQIKRVMALACQQTKDYIQQQGWMPPGVAAPEPIAPVPVGAASGARPNGAGAGPSGGGAG